MPPLVGVAVKLTDVPLQTELADAAIFTEATDDGAMVTVTVVVLWHDPPVVPVTV